MALAALLRRPVAALVGALMLLSALLAPTPARATTGCADTVVCPSFVYFGASLPGLPRDVAGLQAFGSHVGRQPTIANYFAAFGDQLDGTGLTTLTRARRLPMVTWSPSVKGNGKNAYPLTKIASGGFDTYLKAQARTLAKVPGRVAVRFAHEMNASWFPWGRGVNGNTDARYVAAFRHVHDVVTAAGARNVIWVWSPAVVAGAKPLGALYPGSAYVDWVGPDLYLPHASDTVAALWNPMRSNIDQFAANKPVVFAETGAAPGPNRPARITDLIDGLLHTPRLAGIVWFEERGTADWRIDTDPLARAALASQLSNPWFGTAPRPPLRQSLPVAGGAPRVGVTVTATPGTWRSGSGTTIVTGHWFRCTAPTDTSASCVAVPGGAARSYVPQPADWHTYLRYAEHAENPAGSAWAWSPVGAPVQTTPMQPGAPLVTALSGGLKVTFPDAPFGATHWLLTLDASPMVPIPIGTTTYWLPGLANGATYRLTLAAADIAAPGAVASQPVSLSAVPLAGPSVPYMVVTGADANFQLPRMPTGAQAWLLTVDGVTTTIPTTTTMWTSSALTTGVVHSWTLAPVAGSGGPAGWGSVGAASAGSFVPLDVPAAPGVVAAPTGATFTFPALPPGASGWQLTVGPTTYPATTATTLTVTGFASGYSASWSLRAVNAGARSPAVAGRFVPA